GECLVDEDDLEHSPNDRGWGARELHEAIRLGRQAGTHQGLVHAAIAGLALARVTEQQGNGTAAAGIRAGVCMTREQALSTLNDDEKHAFDADLKDALGEDPATWCATNATPS